MATGTIRSAELTVTRLGLGTGPLGGWPEAIEEAEASATIVEAWERGIRLFDTAPLYGYGQSETRLGKALATRPRSEFVLSTKVGRLLREPVSMDVPFFRGTTSRLRPVWDFSYEGTFRSVNESLERLQLDRIDIALIHDADNHLEEAVAGAYVALNKLRSAGTIKAIGAGMNRVQPLIDLISRTELDCVLVAGRYTLLDQDALGELLPLAQQRNVSVIVGGVFNSGILANPAANASFDYRPATPELIDRARLFAAVCESFGVPLKAAAMQFPLGHPAVTAVVTGARTPDEIGTNASLMSLEIPSSLWAELHERGLLPRSAPTPS